MLVLMILAVVWAAVLVPPIMRNRREGRPGSSVMSFRAQLSTLERATPGSHLRPAHGSSLTAPALRMRMTRADVKRRRREVLLGLLGATAFTFLLAVVLGGAFFVLLFLATGAALGAYVYALRQLHLRAQERAVKVRSLVPRTAPAPSPVLALRRSATH